MQTTAKHQPKPRDNNYHDALRQLGGLIFSEGTPTQIHHVVGASAKHNKVPIGQRFVYVVPSAIHDSRSQHPLNVTNDKKRYEEYFGDQKKICFQQHLMLVGAIALGYIKLDIGDLNTDEEISAIAEYRR